MILFYSDNCQHCKILLETIARHDTDKIIKLVSVDKLRELNKPMDKRINSVPALYFIHNKEIIFGKAVFDHLLLPNTGVLFNKNKLTRGDKNSSDDLKELKNAIDNIEPMAFSLGSVLSDNFSNITDDIDDIVNKNYKWDLIDNNETITGGLDNSSSSIDKETIINKKEVNTNEIIKPISTNEKTTKDKLPSMEELLQKRATEII